jgi:selenocysteine-specific elongation factor
MLEADAARWKIVHAKIKDAGMRPPTVEELAESCHMELQLTRSLLLQAEKLKLVTRLEPNRFFLPDTLQQLAHRLAKLAENSTDGRVTAADYRDQSGLGRNDTAHAAHWRFALPDQTGRRGIRKSACCDQF